MEIATPPEIDTEEIGRNPENPLLAVEASHEKLTDTISRICHTIAERPVTMNALIGKAHTLSLIHIYILDNIPQLVDFLPLKNHKSVQKNTSVVDR